MIVYFEEFKPREKFTRNGKECYLCTVRKKLIIVTPEEEVRQALLNFFINKQGVLVSQIDVEVPLSRFKKNAKGRADIILYEIINGVKHVSMIVECKQPKVALTDDVVDQILRYDDVLLSSTLLLTNGENSDIYFWNEDKGGFKKVKKLPEKEDDVEFYDKDDFKINFHKISEPITDDIIKKYSVEGVLGEDTPKSLIKPILNIDSLLMNYKDALIPHKFHDLELIKDLGIRYTSFGNVAGGDFPNLYRAFMIKDKEGNHQIISLSINASGKLKNDPVFGTSTGRSLLFIGIDNNETSHVSAEINLHKSLNLNNSNSWELIHSGRITVGKKGAAKISDLKDFISKGDYPLDITDLGFVLGQFDANTQLNINDNNVKKLIQNLIIYGIARDDFRNYVKSRT